MARLPTRDDLGGLPSARSGRVIASFDTSAAGRGLADLGASIAGASADIGRLAGVSGSGGGARVSQGEAFEAQRRFLEFQSAQELAYEESKNTVDPGAFGFREQAQKNYLSAAKEFFSSIPDALKPEYDMKLFQTEDALLSRSRDFETKERTRYYGEEVNKGLGTLENKLFSNPGDFDKNFSEGVSFINAIPDESISRIQKSDLVKQWRNKAQLASLNGVTPQERIRLLGGIPDEIQGEAKPSPNTARLSHAVYGRAQQTAGYFQSKHGLSPIAAAAVAGHAVQESGVKASGAVGDSGTAFGVFQWRGDRLANLKKFASSNGRNWQDIDTQLDFAAWEGQNGDAGARRAWAELQSAQTLEDAVAAWMHFERPQGYTPSNPRGGHAYEARLAAARRIAGGEGGGGGISALAAEGGIMNAQFDAARADPRFADMNYADAQKIISGAQAEIQDDMKQAESFRREAAVQQRGMIETAIQNAPVAILNTGGYDRQLPTREEFIAAYGSQDGSDRFAKFAAAVDVSKQAFDFRAMPTDEIEAAVNQARPTSTGDDAAVETARYETLTKAAQEAIKSRNADPSAYVQQTFPSVAQAWEEAEISGDYRTALAATASAQEQLGIRDMRLLPKQTATQAITAFKDENTSGEQRIAAVNGLIFSTNDKTQRRAIFEQLVDAGLPDTTEGAIEAYSRGDDGAGRRLMEAAIIDPSKLPGTTNLKPADIDAEIQAKIMDEGQVGDIFYGLSDGSIENQERAIRDSKLLTNAVSLRVRNGETLEAAIDGAAKDLYGDIQPVTGNSDVNAQILIPADADPVAVLDGLAGLLPTVRARLEESLVAPADLPVQGSDKAVFNAVTANHIDNVMAEGYFRNSEDGYVFIDPYAGAAIGGADGKPIIFSEDDVRAAPKPAPKVSPADELPQHRLRTPEEIDVETYGKFAPMLRELQQQDVTVPEGPVLPGGGGGGY